MCAINPKHERHYVLSVYTTMDITKELFDQMVASMAVEAEVLLNTDMRLRWHIKEEEKSHGTL